MKILKSILLITVLFSNVTIHANGDNDKGVQILGVAGALKAHAFLLHDYYQNEDGTWHIEAWDPRGAKEVTFTTEEVEDSKGVLGTRIIDGPEGWINHWIVKIDRYN